MSIYVKLANSLYHCLNYGFMRNKESWNLEKTYWRKLTCLFEYHGINWQHICYACWVYCLTDSRHSYGYHLCPPPSCWLVSLFVRGIFHPGVIWYFDPHGILTPGLIFIHGKLTPLLKTDTPPLYGKLNPHGNLSLLISNQETDRGVKIPWLGGSIYHG